MVIVRLNDWTEFLNELERDPPKDRVVRLTFSLRSDHQPDLGDLTMVAGYLRQEEIVEVVDLLGHLPSDNRSDRAGALQSLLEERKRLLESKGMTVRPGRYIPPTMHSGR